MYLAIFGAVGCAILASKLSPLVLTVYSITCPIGLVIYFFYGIKNSNLAKEKASSEPALAATAEKAS